MSEPDALEAALARAEAAEKVRAEIVASLRAQFGPTNRAADWLERSAKDSVTGGGE